MLILYIVKSTILPNHLEHEESQNMRNLLIFLIFFNIFLSLYAQEIENNKNEKKDLILKEKNKQKRPTNGNENLDNNDLPNLFAILVGVNKYDDTENIRSLVYAVVDVKGIHDILSERKRIPYRKSYIHLLTDDSTKKPTRINIYSSLVIVRKMAGPEDTILFYFSGHGIEEEGESYLLPSDTNINALTYSAVPIKDIHNELSKSKAKRQVIILDACHSGARKDKGIGGKSEKFNKEIKDIMASADGRVILSSSDVNESSYEFVDEKHGVYTYFLMKALEGKADSDDDGYITVQEAHKYVFDEVRNWAFNKGVSQNPRIDLNMSGSIVLTVNLEQIPRTDSQRDSDTSQQSTETIIADFDGAEMVLIPKGKFCMGSKLTEGESDEHPRHEVYLDDFYIDLYEVTNAQYAIFLETTEYKKPKYWNDEKFNQPEQSVVGVSWFDANEYAKWVGRRLPTEAEWEKAARGSNRLVYPWGNEWNEKFVIKNNIPLSAESEKLDISPYGVKGMATNVAEWVADYYKKDFYFSNVGEEWINPICSTLPGIIKTRVVRGASWKDFDKNNARCAKRNRNMPNMQFDNVGFRLVQDYR